MAGTRNRRSNLISIRIVKTPIRISERRAVKDLFENFISFTKLGENEPRIVQTARGRDCALFFVALSADCLNNEHIVISSRFPVVRRTARWCIGHLDARDGNIPARAFHKRSNFARLVVQDDHGLSVMPRQNIFRIVVREMVLNNGMNETCCRWTCSDQRHGRLHQHDEARQIVQVCSHVAARLQTVQCAM